jgi:hypothetical protein
LLHVRYLIVLVINASLKQNTPATKLDRPLPLSFHQEAKGVYIIIKGISKMIDQKTVNRDYPLPNADNKLKEDVVRLNDAFVDIDTDINDLYATTGTLSSGATTATQNTQNGALWHADSTGNGAAYEVVLDPAPTTLNSGLIIHMKAHVSNTGSATLNVNSLGIKAIKKTDGSDLKAGDILFSSFCFLLYDGINFQLINPKVDQAQTEVNTSNIMRAFEEIQENHGGSLLMEAGWSDSFANPNEQGADEASSTGYQHDASATLYKGGDPGLNLNSDKNYDTESDHLQQEWTNSNQGTSQATVASETTVTLSSGIFPTNCEYGRISFDNGSTWNGIRSRDSDTQLTLGETAANGTSDYIIRMSEFDSGEVKLNKTVDSNTLLLLHGEGSDASTTITDSSNSSHLPVAVGNAQIDTGQQKFGSSSIRFDGNGDYITVPDHLNWDFQTSATGTDFTIDFWVRFNTLKSTYFYGHGFETSDWIIFNWNTNNTFTYTCNIDLAEQVSFIRSWTPSTGVWYHIALIRGWGGNADDWAITVNGSQVGATHTDSSRAPTSPDGDLIIGALPYGLGSTTYHLDGWIDEYRISNIARWTTNFTPPAEPYVPSNNTANIYVSSCDAENKKTYTSGWTDINSGSVTETLNSQDAYYWLTFDSTPSFGTGTEIKIFKNTDSEVAGNSSSYVPDANDAHNRTLVDLFYSVGNNQTVTQIGIKVESSVPVDITAMIFNEDSVTQYDVLYSEAGFTHTGGGEVEWFTLSTPYVTPASGTIRIGYHNGTAGTLKYYQNDPATMVYRTGSAPTGNDVTFSNGGGQIATSYKHLGATPSVWRAIAKNDGSWKYNNDATDTAAEDWVSSTVDDMLHAVSQAISSQSSNRMTGGNLASITDAEWEGTGGWSTSVNSIVRGVTLYSNASILSPSISQYRLNYDSERGAMDLRSKTYDPRFVPSEGYVWSRIEHSDSDGPGTFYVTRNGGTEWTAVPMAQQGLPLAGDIRIYRGTVDVSGQASGQDLRCRHQTEQGKDQFLHSWGLQAKS